MTFGSPPRPAIMWHVDAGSAWPQTIRDFIEGVVEFASELSPVPVRLVVGAVD